MTERMYLSMLKEYSDVLSVTEVAKILRIGKNKAYELQFVFHSDGWFLLHCITALLKNGKLKEPTEGQRKSLMTLIVPQ